MASNQTMTTVSKILRGCFPVWGRELTVEAREAWIHAMRPHDDRIVQAAATRIIERHKGPHLTIADFVEAVRIVKFDAKYDTPAQISGANPDAITLDEFIARNPSLADAAKKFRAIAGRTLDDVTGEA